MFVNSIYAVQYRVAEAISKHRNILHSEIFHKSTIRLNKFPELEEISLSIYIQLRPDMSSVLTQVRKRILSKLEN
jgi:hypothetical protein